MKRNFEKVLNFFSSLKPQTPTNGLSVPKRVFGCDGVAKEKNNNNLRLRHPLSDLWVIARNTLYYFASHDVN